MDALGIPGMTEFEEDGATICVCSEHLLEYCGKCCMDFREMNKDQRLDAAAMYNAVDARDDEAVGNFEPRIITVGYDGRQLTELAPGTRLLLRGECGQDPPKALKATVLKTVWEGDKDNILDYLDPKTNEPMPCYLLEFDRDGDDDDEEWGLVPCCDVHEQLKVLEAQAGAKMHEGDDKELDEPPDLDNGSIATCRITFVPSPHSKKRCAERGIDEHQFQAALKYIKREWYLPGWPNPLGRPRWLLVHKDAVFVTDEHAKEMITAYWMMKPNDVAIIHRHESRKDLNGRECRLIRFSDMNCGDGRDGGCGVPDGRWEVQFLGANEQVPSESVRVNLSNLKPPKKLGSQKR